MRAALLFSLIISSSVLSTSVGRGSYPSQGSPLSPASNPLPFPLRASAAFSSKPARHSPLREFPVDDDENEKKRPRHESPDIRSRHLRVSSLPSSSPAANGTSQAQASAALAAGAPTPLGGRNSSHVGAAVAQGDETSGVMRSSAGLTLADVRRHMQHARRPPLTRANISGSEAGDGGDGGSSMPLSPKSKISQGALHHLIGTPIDPPSYQPIKQQICSRRKLSTIAFLFSLLPPPSTLLHPLSSCNLSLPSHSIFFTLCVSPSYFSCFSPPFHTAYSSNSSPSLAQPANPDKTLDTSENDCPICAEDMTAPEQLIGRIDCNSTHVFCFACIHRSIPVAKSPFLSLSKSMPRFPSIS